MKSRRNFNEMMISEKLRKVNPSEACSASLIKLMNSLYKRRLMILTFVLGNLWMVSTGYGYNVTISTTTSGGTWTGGTTGPYIFTATADNASVNVSDIINYLTGYKVGGTNYTANNVTINTGTTGDVTISAAISTQNAISKIFTINAGGSISVNALINFTPASEKGNTAGSLGSHITLNAGTNVLISAAITTSGGNGAGSGNGGNAGNISINGPGGISLSANLTALGGSTGTGTAGLNGTITINDGAATVTIGGINDGQKATSIISGESFIKQGTGTFKLAGANTYTGTTTISEGTLEFSTINNLGSATSPIVLGSATTKGILTYSGAAAIFTRGFTVNAGGGGITNASANLLTISTGGITNGGAITLSNASSGNTSINSVISSTGSLTINNTGSGITTLSGTNAYTGTTTISAGTLSIANATNLGNATSAIVLGSGTTKGTLSYTGATTDFTRGFSVNAGGGEISGSLSSLSGAIALNGSLTLSNIGNTTISGVVSSTGSFAINNSGNTVILSNANTYSGATSITAGTLQLGNNAALGTSSGVTVESGATLELNGFSTAKPLALNGGTLSNSSDISIYDGAITLGAPSTIAATGIIMLGGGINGNFQLTKIGVGTLNVGTVLSEIGNLTISEGKFTIPVGGMVTVAEATNVNENGSLTLESDDVFTGSLITTTATGIASVTRWMTPRRWHIVSSPVSGQTVGDFLSDTKNNNIPNNTVSGHTSERGMRGFNPSLNQWGNFYTNANTEVMTQGKGYSIRVKGTNGTKDVTFTGTLNAGAVPVDGLEPGKWNCVGNPYTSAIGINSESGSTNFLSDNGGNLDPSYGAIYVWHQTDAEAVQQGVYNESVGSYQTISNVTSQFLDHPISTENAIQQGQAFMVRMRPLNTGETSIGVTFTNAMQLHNTALELKSTSGIWPTIKLTATADSITSSTIIAFHEGMTPGLDPTYDAGLLKGGAPVEVYTRLVEDNGIPFDIQALPANYESIVVPVGIDCTKGQQVTFSAQLLHVPSACQVLLEDRLNKVLTDLSVNSYTADLMGSTVSQDRFFLHTSYSTTGMDSRDRIQDLRAWAVGNREMKISGKVSSGAIASLYDLQGRAVAICPLREGNLNSVPLKGLKQGVYMLRVQDNTRVQVQKVMISQ